MRNSKNIKKNQKKYEGVSLNDSSLSLNNMIDLIPIFFMVTVIPFIVRLRLINIPQEYARYWESSQVQDFFSYYKSYGIMILVAIMLVILFLNFKKQDIKYSKSIKYISIGMGLFLLLNIISTVTSEFKDVAMWGVFDRREGLFIHVCYFIMMFYAIIKVKDENDFKYISYFVGLLSLLMIIFGLLQIFGLDPFNSIAYQKMIIPSEYHGTILNGDARIFNSNEWVSLTLYNPNYVGSYASVVIPILVAGFAVTKNKIIKWGYLILAIGTFYVLIESKSQAGLVGIALAIAIIIFVFIKNIVSRKKILLIAGSGIVIAVFALNIFTNGLLINNVVDIFEESSRLFSTSSQEYDPTYGLPIYDVKPNGDTAEIYTQNGILKLKFDENFELTLTDGNDSLVLYETIGDEVTIKGELFEGIMFKWADTMNGPEGIKVLGIFFETQNYYILELNQEDGIHLVTPTAYRFENVVAPHIGFEGIEKIGSGRGYIWSRTLPMLKDTLILGNGLDTYAFYFPQYDIAAKTYASGNPFLIVDKPHNIFLQYGVNSGVLATLALMAAWGIYVIDSIRMYFGKRKYTEGDIYGIACLASVVGYLGAGLFNDSVVSVAPLFWIIFGCGIALNYINKKSRGIEK